MFKVSDHIVDTEPHLYNPIRNGEFLYVWPFTNFDTNGYELIPIECEFYKDNKYDLYKTSVLAKESGNENYWRAPIQEWFIQDEHHPNIYLDHSFILRRHSFEGPAKTQIENAAAERFEVSKLLAIKPLWGFDFSVHWCDDNQFLEVVHIEWDFYDVNEFIALKDILQHKILNTDFEDIANHLLKNPLWKKLNPIEQDDYKANLLGLSQCNRLLKCI